MSTFLEMEYRVDSRDIDMFRQCRPSAVLGILQEAATQASLALKISGPEALEKYNALWMVTRNWVELDKPIRWNDLLTIRTWHRGAAGASSYRDFDILRDGELIGQGVTLWVLVDATEHKLMKMKGLAEFQGTDGGELNKSIKLHRAHMPEQFDDRSLREMRYSDTDINGHINNIRYADFACDAIHLERYGKGKFVRTFQLDYITECMAGETISVDTAVVGSDLFARGVGEDGAERFLCTMTLEDL
jgi:acyl-ACP thioesterase